MAPLAAARGFSLGEGGGELATFADWIRFASNACVAAELPWDAVGATGSGESGRFALVVKADAAAELPHESLGDFLTLEGLYAVLAEPTASTAALVPVPSMTGSQAGNIL